MYSKKILIWIGSLQICSQYNQYDLCWNFCWFQMRQLWKFQQLLIALIYKNVTLWPWQDAVWSFNKHLVLRTSNSMLSVEALNLLFLSYVLDLTYDCMCQVWGKDLAKTPSLFASKYTPLIHKYFPNWKGSSKILFKKIGCWKIISKPTWNSQVFPIPMGRKLISCWKEIMISDLKMLTVNNRYWYFISTCNIGSKFSSEYDFEQH